MEEAGCDSEEAMGRRDGKEGVREKGGEGEC